MDPLVAAIIAVVIEIIKKKCPATAQRDRSRLLARLRDPGALDLFRLSSGVRRRLNVSPREWNEKGEAVMLARLQEFQDLDDDDLNELLERAEAA